MWDQSKVVPFLGRTDLGCRPVNNFFALFLDAPGHACTLASMARPPQLYPPQTEGVRRFIAAPAPRRFILPWKTGCGKTAAALTCLTYLDAPRTLIVCPAVVRNHWWREVAKWCGKVTQDHTAEICSGRKRKLSAPKAKAREAAYSAHIQIVSYDLLKEVEATGWGLIILDELHHLAQPLSKQSRFAASLLKANPDANVLGLSATLIPTEVKQLWNPLRLLFGEDAWGRRARTGDVSWDFQMTYCNHEKTEYGMRTWGVRQDRVGQLRERLAPITYPLCREDIASDLPPLDVKLLQIGNTRGDTVKKQAVDWHDQFDPDDVRKKVILVRHREAARNIYGMLGADFKGDLRYIDGCVDPTKRNEILAQCEAAERCTLIGTHESLMEGVRLMWAEQVLIAEWSQSPGRMLQLLGRFNSIGSQARPQVTILCSDHSYGAAQTLIDRTKAVTDTLGDTPTESTITDTFAAAAKVEDASPDTWRALFNSQKPEDWHDDDDQT